MAAALAAAAFIYVLATLPPRRIALAAIDDGSVGGIFHVHTNRSDGSNTVDEVATAAARAGLKFVVFTDHGDGTRKPDPPAYRGGVLCLDGVEISTTGGHYIAIDMPAAPYPLAGEARDVVDDVRRLGGFGIVAHPDSPKPELRWADWTLPFDAVELLNPDTSWRVLAGEPGWKTKRRLLTALLGYPFRSSEIIAGLIQPTLALGPWVGAAEQRRVVAVAGADAHAKLPLRGGEPGEGGFSLSLPGYDPSFRVMSVHARADTPLTGTDAAADAALVLRAIRNGHVYSAVDGIAGPPSFDFSASNALGTVRAGDVLAVGGAVLLRVISNAPPGFTTVVHKGTTTLSSARDTNDLTVHGPSEPGVYWAEIVSSRGSPPVTWIRSNPVYVRDSQRDIPVAGRYQPFPAATSRSLLPERSTNGWRLEHDRVSVAAVDTTNSATPELRYRFGLADGPAVGQFTSLVYDLPSGAESFSRLRFTIRAESPMRVSVQIRDTTADRWQRSIYVDTTPQERIVEFADVTPVGTTHAPKPAPADFRAILFVVDTTNTKPGASGRVWIGNPMLQ